MALPPFQNEPFLNFADPAVRERMEAAIRTVGGQLGETYPLIVGGERITTEQQFASYNPSNKTRVVGVLQRAGRNEVDRAVEAAWQAFSHWRRVPAEERAVVLLKAAQHLRRRREELNAWASHEVGKNWAEIDGEVAEVIDHCEYYAREVLRYKDGQPLPPLPNEFNEYVYEPLGVGAVVTPFNFPFALPSGMILAAIVTGNPVIWKPASDGAVTAYRLWEALDAAGLPPGILNLLTGSGGEVGDPLIQHPRVRWVAFVGSKDVGVRVYQQAAAVQPGQIWLKRVICELGGKNAAIVDDDADVEWAADQVVAGAFGYQGQKCSATSRLITTPGVHGAILEAVAQKTRALAVGPAPENYPVGPVINASSKAKILEYIGVGRQEGQLVLGGGEPRAEGHYVEPTIFTEVDPGARIAQEEIFGPVLSVIRARDFDHALEIANGTEYGLTGAVFTRDPAKLARAKRLFHCGNLYLNRKSTGAMAGTQPFGGFNMSGTDAKVGGPDYLLYFLQAKTISHRYR